MCCFREEVLFFSIVLIIALSFQFFYLRWKVKKTINIMKETLFVRYGKKYSYLIPRKNVSRKKNHRGNINFIFIPVTHQIFGNRYLLTERKEKKKEHTWQKKLHRMTRGKKSLFRKLSPSNICVRRQRTVAYHHIINKYTYIYIQYPKEIRKSNGISATPTLYHKTSVPMTRRNEGKHDVKWNAYDALNTLL